MRNSVVKKSVMSVKAMKELYKYQACSEKTWDMLYEMCMHNLIASEDWNKFYHACSGWYVDNERNGIADSNNGDKIIFEFDTLD